MSNLYSEGSSFSSACQPFSSNSLHPIDRGAPAPELAGARSKKRATAPPSLQDACHPRTLQLPCQSLQPRPATPKTGPLLGAT